MIFLVCMLYLQTVCMQRASNHPVECCSVTVSFLPMISGFFQSFSITAILSAANIRVLLLV